MVVLLISAGVRCATVPVSPEGGGARGPTAAGSLAQTVHADLRPGDVVLLEDGVYRESVVVGLRGTPEEPIVIRAAEGAQPVIEGTIAFDQAAHVVLEGMTITKSPYPGVVIRKGSEAITVRGNIIRETPLGVWIADGAGMAHRILDNRIHDNATHGIAVDTVNAAPGRETVISGNDVFRNKQHGLEISGNYYIIEKNTVYENGKAIPGTSGIHLFARGADHEVCDHNIIRYNMSFANIEYDGPDGNGIQSDLWCDHNEIYNNVVFGNDGACISLLGSGYNRVENNTCYDNAQRPDDFEELSGELVIASSKARTDDLAVYNTVRNNVLVATGEKTFPIVVTESVYDNPMTIENNLLFHVTGGNLFLWGTRTGRSVVDWNALSGDDRPDFAADPKFVDPGRPRAGGLALQPDSPARAGAPADAAGGDSPGRPTPAHLGAYPLPE